MTANDIAAFTATRVALRPGSRSLSTRAGYPPPCPLSIRIERVDSGEGNPAVAEFLRSNFSDEGQKIVEKIGLFAASR
ncbi:hypothetical protein [Rhodobacteraceae bacterium DSL-40]|uniref:hypothetical protein n=1 Tax=Amaricoccus sp. B4 TaxID=3368557 RepID=UPI000DAC3D42